MSVASIRAFIAVFFVDPASSFIDKTVVDIVVCNLNSAVNWKVIKKVKDYMAILQCVYTIQGLIRPRTMREWRQGQLHMGVVESDSPQISVTIVLSLA